MSDHEVSLPPQHPSSRGGSMDGLLFLLQTVIDPETGINIVDMGLIYEAHHTGDAIDIRMTMTSAACPMSDLLIEDVERCLRTHFPEPVKIIVTLTFDPPWEPLMMSELARSRFGW